jgi:hypothetical protein
MLVHPPEVCLPGGIPLVDGLLIPDHGLSEVLRHTLAMLVHQPEVYLRDGVPLVSQRAQQCHLRRVVAALLGGAGVLKRPSRRNTEQRERENAAGHRSCGALFHGWAASIRRPEIVADRHRISHESVAGVLRAAGETVVHQT